MFSCLLVFCDLASDTTDRIYVRMCEVLDRKSKYLSTRYITAFGVQPVTSRAPYLSSCWYLLAESQVSISGLVEDVLHWT